VAGSEKRKAPLTTAGHINQRNTNNSFILRPIPNSLQRIMHASLVRRQLQGLIPPKIATPKLVSGESGTGLGPLVEFYSKLPKGQATPQVGGIKGRYFRGGNASGKPIVAVIVGLFAIGYTLDYNMHLKHHKNHTH